MLSETIYLHGLAMLLYGVASSLALWAYRGPAGRGWVWLCLIGLCLLLGLRSAIPFWVAINIGLYDFRDALLSALAAVLSLAVLLGLAWRRP